jgi:restriction system-associated AAA family ATPase
LSCWYQWFWKITTIRIVAEIFFFIDRSLVSTSEKSTKINADFEIEYLIPTAPTKRERNSPNYNNSLNNLRFGTSNKHIKITYSKKKSIPEVYFLENEKEHKITNLNDIEEILPTYVIGYSSGENETLSIPFTSMYSTYAKKIADMAFQKISNDKIEFPRLVWTDYSMNIAILISNYLMRSEKEMEIFKNEIKLLMPKSFRIIIQLAHQAAPQGRIRITEELEKNIESLKACATCYKYEDYEKRYILDFYFDDETKSAFKDHFDNSAFKLYTVFYNLASLNNLILPKKYREDSKKLREEKRIVTKTPTIPEDDKVFRFDDVKLKVNSADGPINYIGLSDGEHQFIHVWGTIMMLDDDGVLYLLDEPETHYNPKWRTSFISNLYKIASHRDQEFLITSHSPFIISDIKKENVLIFIRDGNKVKIENPKEETFGASYDSLLKLAFDVFPPVSDKSLDEIRVLRKSTDIEELLIKYLITVIQLKNSLFTKE